MCVQDSRPHLAWLRGWPPSLRSPKPLLTLLPPAPDRGPLVLFLQDRQPHVTEPIRSSNSQPQAGFSLPDILGPRLPPQHPTCEGTHTSHATPHTIMYAYYIRTHHTHTYARIVRTLSVEHTQHTPTCIHMIMRYIHAPTCTRSYTPPHKYVSQTSHTRLCPCLCPQLSGSLCTRSVSSKPVCLPHRLPLTIK